MGRTNVGLIKELSDKIESLPENNIREVIDFVDFLKSKKEKEIKGTPKAILKHCGSWKFQEGELDNILEEILKQREIEE